MSDEEEQVDQHALKFKTICPRPVPAKAVQFRGDVVTGTRICDWIEDYFEHPSNGLVAWYDSRTRSGWKSNGVVCIKTLRGTVFATAGDWIVLNANGEFTIITASLFEAMYDQIPEGASE